MSYSDYGGYAYRDGVRIVDRSDAVISDVAKSMPGVWPGFAFEAQGVPPDEASREIHEQPNGHAVLGDGTLYVGLYKQSDMRAWYRGQRLVVEDYVSDVPEDYWREYNGSRYFDPATAMEGTPGSRAEASFAFPDGYRLDVVWTYEDNYYMYARLTQPDGATWTGWSGYGVGAGLEDGEHGYSTEDRQVTLASLWPSETAVAVDEGDLLAL